MPDLRRFRSVKPRIRETAQRVRMKQMRLRALATVEGRSADRLSCRKLRLRTRRRPVEKLTEGSVEDVKPKGKYGE